MDPKPYTVYRVTGRPGQPAGPEGRVVYARTLSPVRLIDEHRNVHLAPALGLPSLVDYFEHPVRVDGELAVTFTAERDWPAELLVEVCPDDEWAARVAGGG